MENTTQDGNVSWQLSGQLIGPLISSCVALEFVFSLCANLFIVVFTLRNAKAREGLKKSSILLLFNLALTSLIVTIFYMPFVIVASGAGEWIIGTTDTVRDGVCQFTGFIFAYTTSISTYTLAAISFDRFLFIIKPHFHRRYMTWKAALGIVAAIWVSERIRRVEPSNNGHIQGFVQNFGFCGSGGNQGGISSPPSLLYESLPLTSHVPCS